ncbi:MAG: helicase-related protein, partial [Planctomycetota bacterium JB042]
ELFEEIRATFQMEADPALESLKYLALRGVGFHHAGLLPLHKELVERLFTSGLQKLLFTTETFALGINMPARTVVFSSLRKFDGIGFDFIKCREYQQMAGRAGRQGIDDVGLVYSVIDDPRIQRVEDVHRVLFGQIEPIRSRFNLSYSSLLNLHRVLGPRIYEAWESSFNNFQWIRMPRKKREKNEAKQRRAISQRIDLLRELEYLEGDEALTAKGEMAALINGFELPATELFFSGLLEWFTEVEICIVLGSLVFEERRGDVYRRMPRGVLGEHRTDVERVVGRLLSAEVRHQIPPTIREPNWKFGAVMHAFANGAELDDLEQMTNASLGDLVRVFRLTVQVVRQLRKAVRKNREFSDKLARAIDRINRDVVDAKRQLELG